MSRTVHRTLFSLSLLLLLLVLVTSFGWWSLHTEWFAGMVRSRIVATLQTATGGRVELGKFRFNPDTLQASIGKLVIHGTEPAGSKPLLAVGDATVGLKILSILHRDVDIQSIVIHGPEIHLIVSADGSTNVPSPKKKNTADPVQQLLDLKAKHLEVTQGLVEVNDRKVPFALTAENTAIVLDYNYAGPSYGIALNVGTISSSFLQTPLRPIQLEAKSTLFKDRLDVQDLRLETQGQSSTVQLDGKLEHFAQPTAQANVTASLSMDELTKFAGINDVLKNGRGLVKGVANFSTATNQFIFNGTAEARGVDLLIPNFVLRNMSGTAGMVADNNGMLLQHAHASARGAQFSGEGVIKDYKFLEVHGHVSQVSLTEVGTYLTDKAFPWTAMAHGEAHASALVGVPQPDFKIAADVDLDPGSTGIPTSGHVKVAYINRTSKVQFDDSNLVLPHTQLSFNGALDEDLKLQATSTDLSDLQPVIPILNAHIETASLPKFVNGGSGKFEGVLGNLMNKPEVHGSATLAKFNVRNVLYDAADVQFSLSAGEFAAQKFQLQESGASLSGSGSIALSKWDYSDNSPVKLDATFKNLDVVKTMALFSSSTLPIIEGFASGKANITGTLDRPQGNAVIQMQNLNAFGEKLNQVNLEASLNGSRVQLVRGRIQSGQAVLNFSGSYLHDENNWSTGSVELNAVSNGFPLSSLASVEKYAPAWNGRAEAHLDLAGKLRTSSFEPSKINGSAEVQQVTLNGKALGNVSLLAETQNNFINFNYSGDLRETKFRGSARAELKAGTPVHGDLQMDRISLAAANSLMSNTKLPLPLDGFIDGSMAFDGDLENPAQIAAKATIKTLQINSLPSTTADRSSVPEIVLRNNAPIVVEMRNGTVGVTNFEIDGPQTSVKVSGTLPLTGDKPMDLKAVGNADLALFMLFDPNVRSSGTSELVAEIGGTISVPNVTGTLQVRKGTFFFADVANGLSDVDGTVVFNRNRATIQKMTAHSGGGDISLGGSVSFGEGSGLVYHVEADARTVRVRYANSISITANADLRLTGTSTSSLLSGTLTVTRVVFTPNADAGNLLAAASSYTSSPANPEDFLFGLHLDVGIESAPNLQVSTNLSHDVEAEVQLRLRGTPDHPIVLGNINANQGDIKIFGTRFSLNRGEVDFVNAVRVEPVLDLDLETQARGVTVDITVSGPPSKLNFNYRSDPPLQPRDIIALLTVGRTPDVATASNAQGASDASALTSGVNSVLGQAISPVSNRLSKLFGVTNIRIDPFVQGITNTPQARLSIEQQISRDVTVTYITNLSQTSEQIFRFEWALSRQFSIVAIRDDNGEFGIDFQYKKRFK